MIIPQSKTEEFNGYVRGFGFSCSIKHRGVCEDNVFEFLEGEDVVRLKAIVEKFKAKGIDPEGYTLYTYAAFQIWSQAVAKAGGTDAKKVIEVIKAGEWDTVLGKLSFDAKGDIKLLDYVVYRWDAKGNYAEIEPGKGT